MAGKQRVQINLSQEALREIEELKKQLKLDSIADVIRSSLKLTKYVELEKAAGNEIVIRNKKDKSEKEIVFIG